MARVSPGDVTAVIDTSLTTVQVLAFIDDASLWVTTNLGSSSHSAAILKAIEKYLACHFIAARDPRLKEGQFGDTRERYQRDEKIDDYLKKAVALDSTGTVEEAFVAADKGGRFRALAGSGYADD